MYDVDMWMGCGYDAGLVSQCLHREGPWLVAWAVRDPVWRLAFRFCLSSFVGPVTRPAVGCWRLAAAVGGRGAASAPGLRVKG
jgi:hypothetical protein